MSDTGKNPMDFIQSQDISPKSLNKIREIIVEILKQSGAKCGLLIDSAGQLLVRTGFSVIQEIEDLCVLIAASRATSRAIGAILGQEHITVIFHQGSGDHLHSTDVEDRAILTLIFDDRADLSRLQSVAQAEAGRIATLLAEDHDDPEDARERARGLEDVGRRADKRLETVFEAGSQDDDEELSA